MKSFIHSLNAGVRFALILALFVVCEVDVSAGYRVVFKDGHEIEALTKPVIMDRQYLIRATDNRTYSVPVHQVNLPATEAANQPKSHQVVSQTSTIVERLQLRAEPPIGVLVNKDIFEMHKMGLGAEIVLAKIKSSPSNFDTSLSALQELKAAGLDDVVILAVVQSTAAPTELTQPSSSASSVTSQQTSQAPNPIGVAVAQAPSEEAARLLRQVGLPDSTIVSVSPMSGVPASNPIRVYLAFGMDMMTRNNFVAWIKKWNEKESNKHGTILLVDSLKEADLVFARVALREQKATHLASDIRSVPTKSTATTNATAYGDGSYVRGNAQTTLKSSTVVTDQYTYDTVPVFAYILRSTQSGLQILWRYASDVPAGAVETKSSGQQLFNDFKKLAKDRPRLP